MFEDSVWQVALLLVLLVAIFVAAHLATRFIASRGRAKGFNRNLKIVDSLFIGRDKSILVIEAGERLLVVGVTNQSITTLAELLPEEISLAAPDHINQGAASHAAAWLKRLIDAPGALSRARAQRQADADAQDGTDDGDFDQMMKSINERKSRLGRDSRGDDSK